MTNLVEFGKRVKQRRQALDMTQEELAKKTGYTSRSSINKIELGLVDLPQSKIALIAKALQTTPVWLVGWEDNSVKSSIIGDHNVGNTIGNTTIISSEEGLGEIEAELLTICKKMPIAKKAKLLTLAYELLEK